MPRLAIDLSRPRDRWTLIWFSVGTVAFLLLTAVGSYQTFHYTESCQFCGEVCHTVMQPEFTTYQAGPTPGWSASSATSAPARHGT